MMWSNVIVCYSSVASILMGWGDAIYSHHYVPLYWFALKSHLLRVFPDSDTNTASDEDSNSDDTSDSESRAETKNRWHYSDDNEDALVCFCNI
ncbi:hypothetical protein BD769DRAFT_1432812 [Suillus cothurnatus]|nr:hypothetical protein BD769DRAFT_1432812 [Suillus cothurnatus]